MRLPVLISIAIILLAAPAFADWHADLRRQIASEEGCKVDYFSHVTERQIGHHMLITAKVHCEDQRTFDATWNEKKQRFDIRRCGNVEAC